MWSFTNTGFVSIVNKEGGLQVRSRDRESIEHFCDLAGVDRARIVEGGGTDYQFRVRRVSKKAVNRYFRGVVEGITYTNFKNEAKRARGKTYADCLSSIWSTMWGMAPKGAWSSYLRPFRDAEYSSSSRWWDTPRQDALGDTLPSITEIMEMPDDERRQVLTDLDIQARETEDDEVEDLLVEVERLLADERKSIHDYTESEWRELMEETP